MRKYLAIDDRLIQEAQALGGHKSKAAAVTAALKEYVQRRKQAERSFSYLERLNSIRLGLQSKSEAAHDNNYNP